MWFKIGILVGVLALVAIAVGCTRRARQGADRAEPERAPTADERAPVRDEVSMSPDVEGFVLELAGPASIGGATIPVRGRLQIFVPRGSQYAYWREFPEVIQYEVQLPSGETTESIDLSASISDDAEMYDAYAARPSERIVGESFEANAFDRLGRIVGEPGHYRLRARYQQWTSNWVDVEVSP